MGLLLSLTIAEKVSSPLLLDDLRSITRKVGAAFAPAQARRILALRRRILVGQTASTQVLAGYTPPRPAVTKTLLDAFAHRRTTQVRYQDQHGTLTEREIETQFLYYNLPVWYALAWDRLRDDIRTDHVDVRSSANCHTSAPGAGSLASHAGRSAVEVRTRCTGFGQLLQPRQDLDAYVTAPLKSPGRRLASPAERFIGRGRDRQTTSPCSTLRLGLDRLE